MGERRPTPVTTTRFPLLIQPHRMPGFECPCHGVEEKFPFHGRIWDSACGAVAMAETETETGPWKGSPRRRRSAIWAGQRRRVNAIRPQRRVRQRCAFFHAQFSTDFAGW